MAAINVTATDPDAAPANTLTITQSGMPADLTFTTNSPGVSPRTASITGTPGFADALVVARAISANAPASAPISNDLWEGRVAVRMADIRILPPSVDDRIDATAAAVMSVRSPRWRCSCCGVSRKS